ncbi:MAG: hypothetical protein ACJA08_000430 [Cyclobacteriaceae bacterium]
MGSDTARHERGYAIRYHWHSAGLKSFTEEPHAFVYGRNQGQILNLTSPDSAATKKGILNITSEKPERMIREIQKIRLPRHHDVRQKDVDIKRLGAVLALAQELPTHDFESLLLLQGLGPRTLQSLTLVSDVIYGTPSRFSDPARFSFAHGGKDGHPFPVPTKIYDKSIDVLKNAVAKAKINHSDRLKAVQALSKASELLEKDFDPKGNLDDLIQKERNESRRYGRRTVMVWAKKPTQLSLFQ